LNTLQRCKPLLGTFVDVTVSDHVSDKALIALSNQLFDHIEHIQLAMSFHDSNSELSKINQLAHKDALTISADMQSVLHHALSLSHDTEGDYDIVIGAELVSRQVLPNHELRVNRDANWFNIVLKDNTVFLTTPLLIDLGGIAKGYAVDKAIESVTTDAEVTINAGGDLRMTHWQGQTVAIRVPYSKSGESRSIEMQAAALATSGYYFNDQQYVDLNGNQQQLLSECSVSVFADSCMIADSLTKVALLHQRANEVIKKHNATLVILDRNGHYVNVTE
jgi:thiamine biosynthesis lipoprotein